MSFDKAIDLLIKCEGGYVLTNPPEGPTFAGVMQTQFNRWLINNHRATYWPPNETDVDQFYKEVFWDRYRLELLTEPADSVAMQCVVNLPWTEGHQAIQCALGVFPDGDFGTATLDAMTKATGETEARELADRILTAQKMHYCDRDFGTRNFRGLVQERIALVTDALDKGEI